MSALEAAASFAGLPSDRDGPVFAEPWQAQAFALTVRLVELGHLSWPEWADTLGAVLRESADAGAPDDGTRYYEHWLNALERLCLAKGLTDVATLSARTDAWAEAHRTTPHGQPVELRANHT